MLLRLPHGMRLVFKPMLGREKAHGSCVGNTILLDPTSKIPLAKTLLHELLHAEHPEWSEWKVQREERAGWKRLTWREKAILYKQLGKGVMLNDEEDDPTDTSGQESSEVPVGSQ
jgi:hypothetical protein